MQPKSDAQLLREYTDHGAEAAFAEIVARHTNLVYSAALRQVNSPDIAAEVAQNVFAALARAAQSLSQRMNENASLAGWLCRSARNLSLNHRRDEFRRHSRERLAMQTLDPTPDTPPDWEQLRPLLDEAMSELSEPDYDALVLRFFKNQDLRSVGKALSISDDAAQKRVSRAVERMRDIFAKRGITIGASGLAAVISANAVQAAPAGLALTISAATAAVGTTVAATTIATTTAATATKAVATTTLQKTIIGATLAAAVGAGVYEAHQASQLRHQVQALRQQQTPWAEQIEQLRQERDGSAAKLAALEEENESLKRNASELLRLRGEVSRLREAALASRNDHATTEGTNLIPPSQPDRVNLLKSRFEQSPELRIPELQFLTEADWLAVAETNRLETGADFRRAFSSLRATAKFTFGTMMHTALWNYTRSNNGSLPSHILMLQQFFRPPLVETILPRYRLVHTGLLNEVPRGDPLVLEIEPVDSDFDTRLQVNMSASGTFPLETYSLTNGLPFGQQ